MRTFVQRRRTQEIRDSWAETTLGPEHFIQGLFLCSGRDIKERIPGLKGTWKLSPDQLPGVVRTLQTWGIQKVLLFGTLDPSLKDDTGTQAWNPEGPVCQGVKILRDQVPKVEIFTDVCLCGYTRHGHCGTLESGATVGWMDQEATRKSLGAMALAHARAGAHWVAPSAMTDGQVGAIRQVLDHAGFSQVKVLGYSAKYASGFYGPFRGAAESSPSTGDRRTYQMDPRNGKEALEEVAADLEEGAQGVMVKPALSYLDVVARVRDAHPGVPLVAYHTSGEFMMLQAAAAAGVVDYPRVLEEQLYSIRRAGANWIIGYAAEDFFTLCRPGRNP